MSLFTLMTFIDIFRKVLDNYLHLSKVTLVKLSTRQDQHFVKMLAYA